MLCRCAWHLGKEDASGCCHASLAFHREIFDRIGGWPSTRRGDFDQQLIARLNAIEPPGDPCQFEIRHTSSAGVKRTRTTVRRSCRDRKMTGGGTTGCGLKFQTREPGCARRSRWDNRRNRKNTNRRNRIRGAESESQRNDSKTRKHYSKTARKPP